MRVAFLAIGDELLRAESRESNGYALAQRLAALDVELAEMRVVADAVAPVRNAVEALQSEPTLVICTGGLGPTDDDGTRQAMAELGGVPLVLDEAVGRAVAKRYALRGRDYTETERRQAMFPEGAEVLENPVGTAPGFLLVRDRGIVACFPGVPREFQQMLSMHLEELLARSLISSDPRPEVTLRVFGLPESEVQRRLAGLPGYDRVRFRSLPSFPEVRLKVSLATDEQSWLDFLTAARAMLGWRLYSENAEDSLAAATLRALRAGRQTAAFVEVGSGGQVAGLCHAAGVHLGAAPRFVIAHTADEAKRALQTQDKAPTDPEALAKVLALDIRARARADFGVATLTAAPDGASPGEDGTWWIAIAHNLGVSAWSAGFAGLDVQRFRRLVAFSALSRLRTLALGLGETPAPRPDLSPKQGDTNAGD